MLETKEYGLRGVGSPIFSFIFGNLSYLGSSHTIFQLEHSLPELQCGDILISSSLRQKNPPWDARASTLEGVYIAQILWGQCR